MGREEIQKWLPKQVSRKFFRESFKCQEDVEKNYSRLKFFFLENEQQISQKSEHMINLNHDKIVPEFCIGFHDSFTWTNNEIF